VWTFSAGLSKQVAFTLLKDDAQQGLAAVCSLWFSDKVCKCMAAKPAATSTPTDVGKEHDGSPLHQHQQQHASKE
jgi:hypothetical protein